jgi:hypothetical protein
MSDLTATVPADHALALWLIRAMDAGLAALPPSPGVYFRGQVVRGPGGAMPPELAARWEDAHRPGRDVQYFGYTSMTAQEGAQYPGDWQLAIVAASARDLSGFNVEGENERLLPRQSVVTVGPVLGYRWLEETTMRRVKRSRQFADDNHPEALARRAGFSATAIEAMMRIGPHAAAKRAAWEAAGRPGEAAMLGRLQRQNDLQCYGVPGYARNAIIDAEIAALRRDAKAKRG